MNRRPADIASRTAKRLTNRKSLHGNAFRRDTFALPREAAREKARELLRRFPKAAYMTEIESWRVLPGDRIEFTVRRLPSAVCRSRHYASAATCRGRSQPTRPDDAQDCAVGGI